MIKRAGNIDFNVENISKMSFEEFKATYKGKISLISLEDAYEELTGKKASKPKTVKKATRK